MKTLILFLSLFTNISYGDNITINLNTGAPANSNAVNWVCKVKPFTEEYEATGSTKTEAKYNVMNKCKEKNHEMHCQNVTCEGEDAAAAQPGKMSWMCSVKAFTDTFDAMGTTRTEAKFNAMKKCKEKNDEMHCRLDKCDSDG